MDPPFGNLSYSYDKGHSLISTPDPMIVVIQSAACSTREKVDGKNQAADIHLASPSSFPVRSAQVQVGLSNLAFTCIGSA